MQAYKLADKAIEQINKSALTLKNKVKQNLTVLGFDELNVLKQVEKLYDDLGKLCRKKYCELFGARYVEMLKSLGADIPDDDAIDDLAELHITELLKYPNSTTQYAFDTELLRKRDRAKEAITSALTKTLKQATMDKHLRYFAQMAMWYADFTSQDAEITALKKAGVEKVQRHELIDDRTCKTCKAAGGEIYDINKIPPLPHPNCRRWFTPA
jgi:hypothetical protein